MTLPEAPFLATKLRPPVMPAGYQPRDRVRRLLDGALRDEVRLTLVAAPPGYGKTVAVAGWLETVGLPSGWLSLDPGDDDLASFAKYLVRAIAAARPPAVEAIRGLFGPGMSASPELVGASILDAIGGSDDPFVLVLDDFHVIASRPVHDLVRLLVERVPAFCHLVVIGREDPPLLLARLRAHGRLVEVRSDDLRFGIDEATAYCSATGLQLNPQELGRLLDRTEGWIAGLQLASLSIARLPDRTAALAAFEGTQRFVLEYLADEVLDRVDPELRSFLVRTSIADRFSVALAASLADCDEQAAAAALVRAERAHLFIVPLDDARAWYRYHHLFADYLRSHLPPEQRRSAHARAATWFCANGLRREAIAHLLAAGALDDAIRLIDEEARPTLEAGEVVTLLGWLDALPADRLAASPDLVAWRAWALFDTGQLAAALTVAEHHLSSCPIRGAPEGRLLILAALLQTVTGPSAEAWAREGLQLVGDDDLFRASALQAIGLARHASGDVRGAVECLGEAFALSRRLGGATALSGLTPVVQALNAAGRRADAERLCREVLAECSGASGSPPPMAWYVDVVLGMLRYEANDVEEALRLLDRGFEAAGRLRVGRSMVEWGVAYLALARRAAGRPGEAFEALRTAERDIRVSGVRLPVPIRETEARIRLLEGDVAAAGHWAEERAGEAGPDSPLLLLLELGATVTEARVRLAQHRPADARALLARPEAAFRRSGAVAELISVLVLEAVADIATARRTQALREFGEAVHLAAPGGYVRRIVEDGAPIRHLLPFVRRSVPAFVDELVAAFDRMSAPTGRASALMATDRGLIETLTARELEVVRLLATGSRNADVARALGVSTGTARWHVGNVLAKLGEPNRGKAVARARELGLV